MTWYGNVHSFRSISQTYDGILQLIPFQRHVIQLIPHLLMYIPLHLEGSLCLLRLLLRELSRELSRELQFTLQRLDLLAHSIHLAHGLIGFACIRSQFGILLLEYVVGGHGHDSLRGDRSIALSVAIGFTTGSGDDTVIFTLEVNVRCSQCCHFLLHSFRLGLGGFNILLCHFQGHLQCHTFLLLRLHICLHLLDLLDGIDFQLGIHYFGLVLLQRNILQLNVSTNEGRDNAKFARR
mmetsp:Transcript_20322/g.30835  ORF Transcript_20322/g.30835 Transcript_20322/m.30835 type:complete len:237 (-) Transcript_20322:164-874(-)